ncbi:MAG: flagellar export protein FliJ [Selenomonas sp.]|nr:flagellar export protein FliJ [Selenomonas sp.]
MKKFKFQLETLLRVTRRKKDDAERDFAEASRKLEEAREGLNTLMAEMQKGQRDYDALAQEGVRVTVGRLMAFNSFFAWKREQIEMQQGIVLQMKGEKQKKLKALMEVMSYLKSIEQLKERRWQEYQTEALQEEQKMLDEIGLQLTMRHKRQEVEAS